MKLKFPNNFYWGVATSAFQIEGASNEDGKGPSIWDTFCLKEGVIKDNSNGAVACNHYHLLESDLDLIAELGVNSYRFSISWPRVQPDGRGEWNERGFDFYERLISGLAKRNIKPHLTLYHWDLPQALHDQGGWQDRETCQHFANYAIEVAKRFGSRVESICTHNEPWVVAILGYEHGIFAPGIKSRKVAYEVVHNLLLSHGMAMEAMRKINCPAKLGIVLNLSPIYPASESEEDIKKAKIDDGLILRWFLDPLIKKSYPQDAYDFLGEDAPIVQANDMNIISQTNDFIGVNYYTRNFSSAGNPWDVHASGNEVTDMGWEVYPAGLTELLCRLDKDYTKHGLPELMVTENGAAFKDTLTDGQVHDVKRVSYFKEHIAATAKAIESGVNVTGYFAWSLLDNFEWASGYEQRFGIIYVDYASQQRIFKDSALWYRDFLNGLC